MPGDNAEKHGILPGYLDSKTHIFPDISNNASGAEFNIDESILWSLSSNPNIVGLPAYSDEQRTASANVDSWDLPRFLAEAPRPMPINGIIRICRDVAQAVKAAHTLGVAHRAIKSSNIFVIPSSPPVVQLGNFAQARSEYARGLVVRCNSC